MIACFPEPYPDELVYSWITRYFHRSGYLSLRPVYEDIYGHSSAHPNVEFLGKISEQGMKVLLKFVSPRELVERHTMFPYYARFLPPEKRMAAFDAIRNNADTAYTLMQIPRRMPRERCFLKYCPMCAAADRQIYAETYWHRSHQPVEYSVCPIHHCFLTESNIPLSSTVSHPLTPAEEYVPHDEIVQMSDSKKKNLLFTYVYRIFGEKMNLNTQTTAVDILQEIMLNTPYMSSKGERRHIERLCSDLSAYYGASFPQFLSEKWQVQSIMEGRKFYSFDIGLIGMFLDVDPRCLARLESPNGFKAKRFLSLSAKHNPNMRPGGHTGYRRVNWHALDGELLPSVKETIRHLASEEERPQKISAHKVAGIMNIPYGRLQKCPLCMAEIRKYAESQEEYWARLTVWSVKKLVEEGRRVNRTHINEVSHIRTCDFSRYEKYINRYADKSTAELIRSILS